ncbi:hypothetical protein SAMN05444671_3850 [Flavobacterium sp. CF108]|jgi:hypothetical protein|uniref:hypothetical protein n=1 Tax=unclassified Flavobacterium TaxID=196869 RepID=UPI0008AEFDB1|nr:MULTISPECIES: hypothetical protein [unclassified Flavobacterium]SEO96928.1 hypothetical protein SAMN04487978_4121 [Flavobacterium sp. fv08]SHH81046.1 hypothetical protein SAMN05444671_3850 [Flavobacterium sp. CF108]
MKKILALLALLVCQIINCQTFSTNLTPVGWEHNILFNSVTRYTVTQEGPAINLPGLFDGSMNPYYMAGVTPATPKVILIEGLSGYHTQSGAWVGWTTRYLPASRFKIEGYDTYNGVNVWRVIADYSNVDYGNYNFSVKIPVGGVYSKLKFTFYNGQGGNVGLSELFFIHPEATSPYSGLLTQSATNWQNSGTNLSYNLGNVGIGINSPQNKLDVNGTIHAKEVKVDVTGWPDYVFKNNYNLPTLEEVEKHIKEKGHLENIPNEEEALENGISLGEMNAKLLQKIEELTLYIIKQNKEIDLLKKQEKNNDLISLQIQELQNEIHKLKTK